METGRPADHHEATLRLLLNGLIATVDLGAAPDTGGGADVGAAAS